MTPTSADQSGESVAALKAENERLRSTLDTLTRRSLPLVEVRYRCVWRQQSTGRLLADMPVKALATACEHARGRAENGCDAFVERSESTWEPVEGCDFSASANGGPEG